MANAFGGIIKQADAFSVEAAPAKENRIYRTLSTKAHKLTEKAYKDGGETNHTLAQLAHMDAARNSPSQIHREYHQSMALEHFTAAENAHNDHHQIL